MINYWKTYIFSKTTCKLKRRQNGGIHTVTLQSNYHSRSYCEPHHVNYLSLKGRYIFARLPVQLGQSGRCGDSGLTGLMIPLLMTYIVSKTHKGTYNFCKRMLFCWRLTESLLLPHWFKKLNFALSNIFAPSLLLKNIFLLSSSFKLFSHICCKQNSLTKHRHLKKKRPKLVEISKAPITSAVFHQLKQTADVATKIFWF